MPFDNCRRLRVCADGGTWDAALLGRPGAPAALSPEAALAPDHDAATLPNCVDPSAGRSRVVIITGSSNFPPLLAKLAPLILASGYAPVYRVTSSCSGVKSVFGPQPSDHFIDDPIPGSNAKYAESFAQDGTSTPCLLGPGGAPVDVGESDVFSTTCSGFGAPGGDVGEYLGPIQAMVFVVPGKSRQTAISAEAARIVFGMGGDDGRSVPWTNPSLYFVRNANTGTQQMIARAIGVPADAFWGIDRGTALNVDALLKVISEDDVAQQAIGIISTDYYDRDRTNLRALAFEAAGQECAYLPDSTAFKRDKQNVRDGHYPVWGPLHFFAALSNGVPVSPAARAFVSVVSVPNVPQALLDAFIESSLVPTCAMNVQRSSELGPLSANAPPFECGCYFDSSPSVNGSPPARCTRCRNANDCTDPARPACNMGYCEVQ